MTTRDEWTSYIGEGIHTAFRKAGQSEIAARIHRDIAAMDPDEWDAILCYLVDGLGMMGEIEVAPDA